MIYLKPLKYDQLYPKPDPFFVCDIEARDWTRFLVIGLYDGKQFVYFKRMDKFFNYLFQRAHEKRTIFAHFGGIYDFSFIMDAALKDPRYKVKNIIPRGSGVLSLEIENKKHQTIRFSDSSAFLPFSLDRICKAFNVQYKKLKWDHSKTHRVSKKLVYYLKHDCVGLYEAIEKYRKWPLIQKAGPKTTMASQAIQVLRLFLKRKIPALPDPIDHFVRGSYFGGRTEVFKPLYIGKKPIYCYDVNSLYPTVMRENDFPVRYERTTYQYLPEKMGFYDAKVEVPASIYIPPLGVVHKDETNTEKFIFPTGVFEGRWSTIELEYARSIGVKILSTGKGVIFENGGPIFRDFIDTLYQKRKQAKKDQDSVTDVLTKLLMNSSYGRFGLNRVKEEIVEDTGEAGMDPDYEIKINDKERIYFCRQPKVLEKTFTNVAIAAWVTSLARIHMHQQFMKAEREIYYTDTDSLFTTKKLKEGKNLGDLKLEYRSLAACFLLPKTYIIHGILDQKDEKGVDILKKVVMKGFGTRKIQKFEFEDFMTALEGELRVLRVEYKPQGIMKFKSALRKGSLLLKALDTSREIRSQYTKRKIIKKKGDYDTRPIHIC